MRKANEEWARSWDVFVMDIRMVCTKKISER
jgi:hypothetical protein